MSIWIDFNTDSEFSSDELILTDFHIEMPGILEEVDVFIPVDVITTNTIMRVGANFQENSSPDPCATFAYGEWEDYNVNIAGLVGNNEVTFHVMEPDGSNYEGASIQFFEQTGTTDSNGAYTFSEIALGTYAYEIALENDNFYHVQGEVEVIDPSTTIEVELIPNTDIDRNFVIIEEFTATWCYSCPAAANGLEEVREAGYEVGIIAYHNADEYSTGNDVRMSDFYDLGYLPSLAFDGEIAPNCSGLANESCFDTYEPIIIEQMDRSSPYDISFSNISLNGNELSATVDISYPGFTYAEDVHLLVAITESDIEEEWEGLTHLNFVERGMFPDFNGILIDLEQNEDTQIDISFSIDPSWNTSNMEVVAFLQDFDSHEIFNGVASPIETVGMEDSFVSHNIQLFPNPATSIIKIQSAEEINLVQVFNHAGQLLIEKIIKTNKVQLNTARLSAGIYFVKVFSSNSIITQKLVIE